MTTVRSIEIEDRNGATLVVETDGTVLQAVITGADQLSASVELDEADRKDLRDFLTAGS